MLNLVVYNRLAGKGRGEKTASKISRLISRLGQEVILFSNDLEPQFEEYLKNNNFDEKNTRIIVVGGDGTLSTIVNAVKHSGKNFPLAVYPAGTANDFSSYAKLPKNKKKFVRTIFNTSPKAVDLIMAENYYGIHAVGSGNFTHSMENFNKHAKRIAGRFGYYIKCFFRAFKKRGEAVKIVADGKEFNADLLFFYVVNSAVVGGFKKFSPQTKSSDGVLELVGFKPCNFFAFVILFIKMILGCHLKSKNVVYLRAKEFKLEVSENSRIFKYMDVDGNLVKTFTNKVCVEEKALFFYTKEGGVR